MTQIVFSGDLFAGGDLLKYEPQPEFINIDEYWEADQRVVNLENPFANHIEPADKSTLYSGPEGVKYLNEFGVDVTVLANNHIHDLGDQGIIDTIRILERNDIGHVGAGKTIRQAEEPYWLSDEIALLGYCQFGERFLSEVQPATEDTPGVNPLSWKKVNKDLEKLPKGTSAFLYIHWGREHVWLPPQKNIRLAKKLLQDNRVAGVIGSHAHLPQGYLEGGQNQRAYFSLGNFLFPNFSIEPRTQLVYPPQEKVPEYHTKGYHRVEAQTYKTWPTLNRISLLAKLDVEDGELTHVPVVQGNCEPIVTDIGPPACHFVNKIIEILSKHYRSPSMLYETLYNINCQYSRLISDVRTFKMLTTQIGFLETINLVVKNV
jgi:poly-gamma-glutamate synthesis protein (capsule biosynthesis protein)